MLAYILGALVGAVIALAAYIAAEGRKDFTVVTDSVTSDGLKTYIEKTLGGTHYRYRRGYKNVIDKAKELCAQGVNCPLAIETSGHAAFRENYYLDDGAYLMTKIVIQLSDLRRQGKELDALIASLKDPLEAAEIRLKINCDDFKAYGNTVIDVLSLVIRGKENWRAADDNREGMRVFLDGKDTCGWFLLRLSVHDPIIPITIESDVAGGTKRIAAQLLEFLSAFGCLDLGPLRDFLK